MRIAFIAFLVIALIWLNTWIQIYFNIWHTAFLLTIAVIVVAAIANKINSIEE